MTERSIIPCDPANPGHVLACLGLMACEAVAARALSTSEGEASSGEFRGEPGDAEFELTSPTGQTIEELIGALMSARVVALRPVGVDIFDKKVITEPWRSVNRPEIGVYPASPPEKPSALPVRIDAKCWSVFITSWAEPSAALGRDNAKFWAGNYTSASVAQAILSGTASLTGNETGAVCDNPLGYRAPLSSSYRLDYMRDYVPLDAGFSPNEHKDVVMVGHPLVELLAAIGLEHARPERVPPGKLTYRYGVPSCAAELPLLRAAFGGAATGLPVRRFRIELGWPGKEGQARCITRIHEEKTE